MEEKRRLCYGETAFPKSVCFPESSISETQYPWYALLTEGKLPEERPEQIPSSWLVSPKWMKLLEESFVKNGEDWNTLLHYGVMLYEQMDEEHVASAASVWLEYPKYTELARQAFRRSVE